VVGIVEPSLRKSEIERSRTDARPIRASRVLLQRSGRGRALREFDPKRTIHRAICSSPRAQ
jgi:hypothetical protein